MNRCQTKHLNFLNISACIMTFLDVPHGCTYSTLMVYKLLFVYVSKFVLFVLLKLYVHVVQCSSMCEHLCPVWPLFVYGICDHVGDV